MAEQDMEEDLNPADYEVDSDATDLPITQRGLDIASLLQSANTGAQGRPMPSYAADAANANTRVAQALERSLRQAEEGGLRRIGAALTADIASSGRTPYGATMERLEASDIQRDMQAAQTLQGIDRAAANLLQRRSEAAARAGNAKAQRINEMIRAAASGFEDPVAAQERMYQFLATRNRENPNLDLNELPGLMAEAISDARRAGLRRAPVKGQRAAGVASGAAEIPRTATGEVDYTKPIAGPKTEWERAYNRASPETRKRMDVARWRKFTGEDGGTGGITPDGTQVVVGAGTPSGKGAQDRVITNLNNRLATADRVSRIIVQIDKELAKTGATSIGVLGRVSITMGGLLSQVRGALDSMKTDPDPEQRQNQAILARWLNNADSAFREVLGNNVGRAGWLLGDNSEGAQRIRTNVMLLAYAHAKAMDEGGRIARDDVENTLRAIGESAGSPEGLRVAMRALFDDMKGGVEDAWFRAKGQRIQYAPGQPIRILDAPAAPPPPAAGQPSPQPPAPQPQPAPATETQMTPDMQRELEELRRTQDRR